MFKGGKRLFLGLSLVLFLLFSMNTKEIHAMEGNSVEPDKVWRIKFNSFVNFDDITKNSIKILDEAGERVSATLQKDGDNSILINPPKNGYEVNKKYTIKINNSLHGKRGKLKEGRSFNFTVKAKKKLIGNYDDTEIHEEDSITSKPGKVGYIDNLKITVNKEGKAAKDLNFNVNSYIDERSKEGEILSSSSYSNEELKIPLKLNGWFKISAGYLEDNNNFELKDSLVEEGNRVFDINTGYSGKSRKIKEQVVLVSNFNNSEIEIRPIGQMAIAYIKVTGLTEKEISLMSSKDEYRPVILDVDGYSKFFDGSIGDEEKLNNETVRVANESKMSVLNWCLGTTGLLNYNSKYAGNPLTAFDKYENTMRTGDFKAKEQIEYFINKGKTPLSIIAEEGDKIGTETYASLRMNIFYDPAKYGFLNGTIYDKLIKYKQKTNWNLDYQYPQVRDYIKNIIKEATLTEGVDGITLDFCRYPVITGIEVPQNKKVEIINGFMREVRKAIPKDKKINVRVSYNEYVKEGYDLKTWIKEGLVDVIIPSGIRYEEQIDMKPFLAMAKGSNVKVYQCVIADVSGKDYTKQDEITGKISQKKYLDMEDYLNIINKAYNDGVHGIFLFNTSKSIVFNSDSQMFSNPKQLKIYYEIYNEHKTTSKNILLK